MLFCCLQMFVSEERSSVWGKPQVTLPPYYAAFVNGVAVSLGQKMCHHMHHQK